MDKSIIKKLLGEIPLTAELYWLLRQRGNPTAVRMSLERLKEWLPEWKTQIEAVSGDFGPEKKIMVFGMVRYWLEHVSLLGMSLAGMGHQVTLAFLPYAHWKKPINQFDLRRQNIYVREVLQGASPWLDIAGLLDVPVPRDFVLPRELADNLEDRAFRDTQYAMLVDEVERDSDLYRLRLERDTLAAKAALVWMQKHKPEVVITPNGSILEFGVIFQVASYLEIPVVTFEFGEQNYRMWMAQDRDVMRQETDDLWNAQGGIPLTEGEWEKIRAMFASRQGARLWETFSRQWQGTPAQGGAQVRIDLGLDERPLAFLPTNVLGDSLTLGRQVFSGMTEWLRQTIRYFIDHPEYQLVVRIHPGEQIGWGPSVFDILSETFPELPENVKMLPADAKVNSYDLVETADVGIVYTTTMGMEMAMSGQTVIVAGQTHYRAKGFTLDAENWDGFYERIDEVLMNPAANRLTREQVELAWRYAYRFFFEYPQPFPWHIQHFDDGIVEWPIPRVFSEEGIAAFGDTFRYIAGEPINWNLNAAALNKDGE